MGTIVGGLGGPWSLGSTLGALAGTTGFASITDVDGRSTANGDSVFRHSGDGWGDMYTADAFFGNGYGDGWGCPLTALIDQQDDGEDLQRLYSRSLSDNFSFDSDYDGYHWCVDTVDVDGSGPVIYTLITCF